MNFPQYTEILLERLQVQDTVDTLEAVELLGLSEASVRRVFARLEKEGRVMRIYGGIRSALPTPNDYSFEGEEKEHLACKQMIAFYACELIQDGDIIYLDGGTTVYQLALAIKERVKQQKIKDLRVVTNSMINLQVLHDICNVIVIGGTYVPNHKSFVGYISEKIVKQFWFKKAFFGTNAFHSSGGFMVTDSETARINEIVISRSDKNFVVMDSSKIGKFSFVSYASPDKITLAVTDDQISEEARAICESTELAIQIASANKQDKEERYYHENRRNG